MRYPRTTAGQLGVGWLAGHRPTGRPARVLELGEEYGEAAEVITGALGANPLKGNSHRWQDVEKELKELSDVIVTAVLALATSSPDPEKALADRV
ncbi:MazG-like family protein [Streptomyces sp. NPDC086080]|uniref:MazG-like family protein n=1 Tax=Streptomyces sp. NPDC086080 TaxID=3365748 RepID=UPI0037D327CF